MGKFRGNLTRAECKELIAKVDKDGNGTISIAEFLNLLG
jgi:Ca2+-binding EF-hand superfamily protein